MLTVWMLGSDCADGKLIAKACAEFEKQHKGVRVFLRMADAQELTHPEAVRPDVVLLESGSINIPDQVFVPLLDETEPSGMFAGVCYAVPLWLAPNVLCLMDGSMQIDWAKLVQPGALRLPEGVALQQLLCMCPYPLREALSRQTDAPGRNAAQVCTLAQAKEKEGAVIVLTPAVSDRVRYAALCRDHQDTRDFLQFLQGVDASAYGLLSLHTQAQTQEERVQKAAELFAGVKTLPNAFAHLRSERKALCRDAFLRGEDPVETLLKLR